MRVRVSGVGINSELDQIKVRSGIPMAWNLRFQSSHVPDLRLRARVRALIRVESE
jgi:hypothetical protein